MSSNGIQKASSADLIEKVVVGGDLSKLSSPERLAYYSSVCESVGLNPLTKPFDYLTLNGKMQLYATKNCTDQLRKIHNVSVTELRREIADGVCIVTCVVKDSTGRMDSATGACTVGGLKGDALCNAIMKSETKSKRRATLSICGLSMLDETELETVPAAHPVVVVENNGVKNGVSIPAPGQSIYITPKQYADIQAACADVGAMLTKILSAYGASKGSEIKASDYPKIMERLKAKDPAFIKPSETTPAKPAAANYVESDYVPGELDDVPL